MAESAVGRRNDAGSERQASPGADSEPAVVNPGWVRFATNVRVGSRRDPAEREADDRAAQVVDRDASGGCTECGGTSDRAQAQPQAQPLRALPTPRAGRPSSWLRRVPERDESEREAQTVADAAVESSESSTPAEPIVRRKCVACEEEDDDGPTIRRAAASSGTPSAAGREVSRDLGRLRGSGRPLGERTRAQMEGYFGYDLKPVRVHTDARADGLARDLNARAFTWGRDIAFRSGAFEPQTREGRRLIAHELTHVVQGAEGREFEDNPRLQRLLGHLEADRGESAITLMGQLTASEVDQVYSSGRCRRAAISAFGNEQMYRAVLAMNGDLHSGLSWMFIEGTNWDYMKAVIRAATRGHARVRDSAWMKIQFVSYLTDATMAEAVDEIGGPLVWKLRWMAAEGTNWGAVAEKLRAASAQERVGLYDHDDIRRLFVSICSDQWMADAVYLMGGTLVQQLTWLRAEGASRMHIVVAISRADQRERATLYDHPELRDYVVAHETRSGVESMVEGMGGDTSQQLDWLHAEGSTHAPAQAEDPASISQREEGVLDALEGRHHLYSLYRSYLAARVADENQPAQSIRDTGYSNTGVGAPRSPGAIRLEQERAAAWSALSRALSQEGYDSLDAFLAETRRFIPVFEGYALQTAFQLLRDNEQLIQNEYDSYGFDAAGVERVDNLHAALATFRREMASAQSEAAEIRAIMMPSLRSANNSRQGVSTLSDSRERQLERDATPHREAMRRHQELADAELTRLAPKFPVLADESIDKRELADADAGALRTLTRGTSQDRLSDIRSTRQRLRDDFGLVWQMDIALQHAKAGLEIREGSIYAMLIEDRLQEIADDEAFTQMALAALGIGFGLMTMGSGWVLAAGLVGSAVLSAGVAIHSVNEFQTARAMHGTAYDRAHAVSSTDPSMIWLALDIVFAIIDVFGATRVFSALRGPARAALEAGEESAEAMARLRSAARAQAVAAGVEDVDGFVAGIVDTVERQQARRALLEGSADTVSAIERAAGSALDDMASAGLVRLDDVTRSALLGRFSGRPELLRRLGHALESSSSARRGLSRLQAAMPEHATQLIEDLLLRRDSGGFETALRAIGDGQVRPDRLAAMASAVDGASGASGRLAAFDSALDDVLGLGSGERAFLDSMANRPVAEIADEEFVREITISARGGVRRLPDGGEYLFEVAAPNGHTWRVTPDGQWCRFSRRICRLLGEDLPRDLMPDQLRRLSYGRALNSAAIGESMGRAAAANDGLVDARWFNPFDDVGRHGQGFDDILQDASGDLWVVEYKGGSADLSAGQMEAAWVDRNIQRLRNVPSDSPWKQWADQWAQRLEDARANGRLHGRVYSTPVDDLGRAQPTVRPYNDWHY